MRDGIGEWLFGEFSVFGVHFQNWMPVVVALAVCIAILFAHRRSF
jgi:hypothetical protein